MKSCIDLLTSREERLKRAKSFWFKEWAWLMGLIIFFMGLLNFGWWTTEGGRRDLKIALTIASGALTLWIAWDMSRKWRKPELPDSFLDKVRRGL